MHAVQFYMNKCFVVNNTNLKKVNGVLQCDKLLGVRRSRFIGLSYT